LQDGLAKIKGMLFEGNSFELKTDDLIKFEKTFLQRKTGNRNSA
jgi:hypothetical protein